MLQSILRDHTKLHLLCEASSFWWGHFKDFEQNFGLTPLHWLAGENILSVVRRRPKWMDPSRINEKDWHHLRTPLSFAAEKGHHEMVDELLNIQGVNVNARDKDGRTPLSYAAENGHVKVVQRLLQASTMNVDSRMIGTALDVLAKTIPSINRYFASVNIPNCSGRTPFFYAVISGHKQVAQILLDTRRVDINSRDTAGQTPLSEAIWSNSKEMIKFLLDLPGFNCNSPKSCRRTELFVPVVVGNMTKARSLLSPYRPDSDLVEFCLITPLIEAVFWRRKWPVELLLDQASINVNESYSFGITALMFATEEHEVAIMRLLLERGADISLRCDRVTLP
jgi:ankyrin repeat protein